MKARITFKTPDVLDYSLDTYTKDDKEDIKKVADKFIEYDEYVTLEIDTVAGTCVVVPVR